MNRIMCWHRLFEFIWIVRCVWWKFSALKVEPSVKYFLIRFFFCLKYCRIFFNDLKKISGFFIFFYFPHWVPPKTLKTKMGNRNKHTGKEKEWKRESWGRKIDFHMNERKFAFLSEFLIALIVAPYTQKRKRKKRW